MTPEEALQILDSAAASAPLNRQAHVAVQQATETLKKALQPTEKSPVGDQAETARDRRNLHASLPKLLPATP